MKQRQYDIIVTGGGTAGSAAAVAAARRGLKVLLIEEKNCLGGVSTSGGVGWWFASREGMGDIFASTVRELNSFGAQFDNPQFFNSEYLKIVWQLLAERAGVKILFHASVIGVSQTAGNLTDVQIACCSKTLTASARFFIDASGEGDLSTLAGAEFMQGDPTHGRTLHMTLTAWMYETGRQQKTYLPDALAPISTAEELPGLGAGLVVDANRVYICGTKVMDCDATDPFSLSQAEQEARQQLIRIVHYLQTRDFPSYALAASGSTIGIREGRRIVGDYVLRQDEVIDSSAPLAFADGIAVATSQIDFHSLTKAGHSGWRQKLNPYHIPFRCLLPKGFANLLVAGKCISVDQVVHSSCRMTPTCCAMGQAAGTAAALAVELGICNIRDVPMGKLQKTLTRDGVELSPNQHKPFAPDDTRFDEDGDCVSTLADAGEEHRQTCPQ